MSLNGTKTHTFTPSTQHAFNTTRIQHNNTQIEFHYPRDVHETSELPSTETIVVAESTPLHHVIKRRVIRHMFVHPSQPTECDLTCLVHSYPWSCSHPLRFPDVWNEHKKSKSVKIIILLIILIILLIIPIILTILIILIILPM